MVCHACRQRSDEARLRAAQDYNESNFLIVPGSVHYADMIKYKVAERRRRLQRGLSVRTSQPGAALAVTHFRLSQASAHGCCLRSRACAFEQGVRCCTRIPRP